jgi:hypothetical protein
MKTLIAFAALLAGMIAASAPAGAQNAAPAKSHAVKKTQAKKGTPAKKSAPAAKQEDADDPEPDVTGQASTDYACELGNKLVIYQHPNDDQHIAVRWHNRLHQMTRVQTTTGANRFENTKKGLVWIGIPAKSMLLDSKKGQQLANECKSPAQAAPKIAEQQQK